MTRSQAVARTDEHTAENYLVISDCC